MNKKWGFFLGIVCMLLVLGACSTFRLPAPAIFDENLSVEESVHIYFWPGLEITEFNGIPVKYSTGLAKEKYSTWRYVYLPPGEIEFMTDINAADAMFKYRAHDLYFRYKFEAGKTYTLYFTAYGEPVGNDERGKTWGVKIYEEPKEGVLDEKNHEFIAFTRFYKYEDK
jgi:hypothetical protein